MSESCKTCRFWTECGRGDLHGKCRAHPPSIISAYSAQPTVPETHEDYWCGEYQPASGVKASPGLQWLFDNGKRPWFSARDTDDDDSCDEWLWFDNNDGEPSELPNVVMVELQGRIKDLGCGGKGDMAITFHDEHEAMLAAARAIESSQYLAMEAHRKESANA